MRQGFTLIEMSIVLVIIGLIVGGILTGQTLIQSAGLRRVVTELDRYQTAVTTFRGKYDCLPGDCLNATNFFGTDGSGCPYNANFGLYAGTCNGNGDGLINGWSQSSTVNVENILAWSHLSYAYLIPAMDLGPTYITGNSNPIAKGGANFIFLVVGQDVPASAFSPTIGYNMLNADPTLTSWGYYPANITANQLIMQIGSADSDQFLGGPGFSGAQAFQLDTKIDDGNPNTGRLSSMNAGTQTQTCLTGTKYATSYVPACSVYYLMKTP